MAAYGTDVDFQSWLDSYGLTVTGNLSVLRATGSLYVDSAYEHNLQCSKRTGGYDQELAWPRTGHKDIPGDSIPRNWIIASYRAAYLNGAIPGWSTGTRDVSRITKREKVDVIEREFFEEGKAGETLAAPGMPSDGMIEGLVKPLMCPDYKRGTNQLFRVI